jgi:hypothetical protein
MYGVTDLDLSEETLGILTAMLARSSRHVENDVQLGTYLVWREESWAWSARCGLASLSRCSASLSSCFSWSSERSPSAMM